MLFGSDSQTGLSSSLNNLHGIHSQGHSIFEPFTQLLICRAQHLVIIICLPAPWALIHTPGTKVVEIMYPAVCAYKLICSKCTHAECTGDETVHLAVQMCTPGRTLLYVEPWIVAR